MTIGRLALGMDRIYIQTVEKISEFVFYAVIFIFGVLALYFLLLLKSKSVLFYQGDYLLVIYTLFVTIFELSRIIGAIIYRQVDSKVVASAEKLKSNDNNFFEPKVSFVIPCKNEEEVIAHTISKCYLVDYPPEKIEVIVINDGSTDKTGEVLARLKKKYPRMILINWKKNRGKRHGMAAGIKRAKGEIVIQLDSDSYIERNGFRNLVLPFRNPEIGAVCLHCDPANAGKNIITKMQAAYYFMSFRIFKAAESSFMSVFCCSGCASAFRRAAVEPILGEWLGETFLGLPVTWGDDRALTNWVLKRGFCTLYSDRVQAYTICPENLKKFIKQQIRWKKGWFVNSIIASKFILKRHKYVAFTYFFPLILITLITPFMATRALIINPIFRGISPAFYVAGVMLMAILVVLFYRTVNRENKYWPYLFVWSGINMIVLSFILFYALATIQDRRWGTR